MLKAAVLCPGSSLADCSIERLALEYDVLIGVNRAVGIVPCHYWVMLDDHTFEMVAPLRTLPLLQPLWSVLQERPGEPADAAEQNRRMPARCWTHVGESAQLVVHEPAAMTGPIVMCDLSLWRKVLRRRPEAALFPQINPQDIRLGRERVNWRLRSAPTAIVLAHWLGARTVDCYGMDWSGTADFDGHTHPLHNRDAARWADEAAAFEALRTWLAEMGTTVNRIVAGMRPAALAAAEAQGCADAAVVAQRET